MINLVLLAVVLYLAIGSLYFARQRPDYSHFRHTISELGESGSTLARPVALTLFLPVGLACMGLAAWIYGQNDAIALIVGLMGLSYAMASVFPCDPGTPALGTWRNIMHNVISGLCYVGIGAQLKALSDQGAGDYYGYSFLLLAMFLITFVIGWPKAVVGLLQRLAELGIFVTVALALHG